LKLIGKEAPIALWLILFTSMNFFDVSRVTNQGYDGDA
jgi:hypothetical protein